MQQVEAHIVEEGYTTESGQVWPVWSSSGWKDKLHETSD